MFSDCSMTCNSRGMEKTCVYHQMSILKNCDVLETTDHKKRQWATDHKKEILPFATTQMTDLVHGSQKPNSQMQRTD